MQVLAASRVFNKENQSTEPCKQLQKLRVELNDRNFQLHKLEEDHAQQKARIFIQLQKEKQNHAKTIKQLKDKIKQDNEGWVRMIDQIRQEKQQALDRQRHQLEQRSRNQIASILQEAKQRHNKAVHELSQALLEKEQAYRKNQEKTKRQNESSTASTLQSFRKELEEKERKHKLALVELKRDCQESVSKLHSAYLKEQSCKQLAQLELQNAIKSHVRQKIAWEHLQNNLNLQISALKNTIQQLEVQIQQLKKAAKDMQHSHCTQIEKIKSENNSKLKQMLEQNCQKEKQNSIFYSAQIQSLKVEIDKLLEIHRKKEESWLQSGKMVLELYQKRQSKKQDVKAIQKLEVQLIKKDFLIERERKQLKNCKLQLQNMEQIYDRIFIYNSNLNRSKTKSYQIKKLKASYQLNQSNRSTILSDKNIERRYQCDKND